MTMDNKPSITIAPQDAIETFEPQVDLLLGAMGFAQALVTDESRVADFMSKHRGVEENPRALARNEKIRDRLSGLMGREVQDSEYLWRLAHEIYMASRATGH